VLKRLRSESWLLEVQARKSSIFTVYVVLLQRMLLLDAAGPLEVLRVANREQQKIRFEVRYVGPEASIVSSVGITLAEIELCRRLHRTALW
jgi:transcriptional regulator GlxA family with amidase domain